MLDVYILTGLTMSLSLNGSIIEDSQMRICYDQPLYLVCSHPPITIQINGQSVFNANGPSWSDGHRTILLNADKNVASYSKDNNITILRIVYTRESVQYTDFNYSCFLPLWLGGVLRSNFLSASLLGLFRLYKVHAYTTWLYISVVIFSEINMYKEKGDFYKIKS